MSEINRGIYQLTVGDATVTALNDGQFQAPPEWVAGIDAAGLEQQLAASFRPFPPRITLNAFLIEQGGRRLLVDAGAGNKFGPALGAVGRHLAALGIAHEQIDTILVTHAHVDHVGGLTDDKGAPLFPKAELVLSQAEHAFWRDDAILAATPEAGRDGFKAARVALDAYASRTRLFADGAEVVPGIRARALPGHTPGHTGYQLGQGPQGLLIWADIVHLPGVQFDRPEVGMAFDTDGAQAAATRRAVLDEAVKDRIMIAGMHLDFPTFAFVRRHAERYELVPTVWTPPA